MNPQSIVKGRIFEGTVTSLFKRARYVTIPLGIENQFPDIDAFTVNQYLEQIPEQLRLLPDLLVYRETDEQVKVHMVEIKYLSEENTSSISSVMSSLEEQMGYWPETICILGFGRDSEYSDYHQRYIRVIGKEDVDSYEGGVNFSSEPLWEVFPEFSTNGEDNPLVGEEGENFEYARQLEDTLDNTVQVLKTMRGMEV